MSAPDRQYSTGLPFLDRRIDGGLAAGTLLALVAAPRSQSHLLLRQLVQTRATSYVSLLRPAADVEAWAAGGPGTPADLSVTRADPEALLDDFSLVEAQHTPESFVVVDRTNGLEAAPRDAYLDFLDRLASLCRETDSVGVLRCADAVPEPPRRGLTLDRADQVWQLELLSLSREIKNRLLVTKSRTGRALREPIDVLLTDTVQVDTSRKIS